MSTRRRTAKTSREYGRRYQRTVEAKLWLPPPASRSKAPTGAWQRCERIVRQIHRARLRNWYLAAEVLKTDLQFALRSVESDLATIAAELPSPSGSVTATTSHDKYMDLVALAD